MNQRFKTLAARCLVLSTILGMLGWAFIYFSNKAVVGNAQGKLHDDVQSIPHNKVGLLLGSNRELPSGRQNPYYYYRINAAIELFNAGKIDYILASGDNHIVSYDEPTFMMEDLIKAGVPKDRIYLDFAGFRTLDSVVRCKEVFGESNITVISQQFHNERAIYIAERKGLNAIGFNAQDVNARAGAYTNAREKLARVKMILDLWFGKDPRFFGEPISIGS